MEKLYRRTVPITLKDEMHLEVDHYLEPIPESKPAVDYITFDQFIEYGKDHVDPKNDGMPWAFKYKGHPVTHENDECYLVETSIGFKEFTPKHVLFTDINGDIFPHEIYVEPVNADELEREIDTLLCDIVGYEECCGLHH